MKIVVQEQEISIIKEDYISLTDMVKNIENGLVLIEKWLRNKNTIEFLGIWEEIYNPNFNSPEFEGIKNEAGSNRFSLSVKMWISKTQAIGVMARVGRYGGAEFIKQELNPQERLEKLNVIAIEQLKLLLKYNKGFIDAKK
jgi:hypothetical protein